MTNNIEDAKDAAENRIIALEVERRAQIVKAVGRDLERDVKILDNGSLWIQGDDPKRRGAIIEALAEANVSAFGQWTPLPREVHIMPAIEEWQHAGQRLEDTNG